MSTNIAKRKKAAKEGKRELSASDKSKWKIDNYDSSDEESPRNTIGNVPLSWYGGCIHIGYDKDGNPIMKNPKKDEMDLFLEKVEDPDYWRKVFNPDTGDYIRLSHEQVERLLALGSSRYVPGYNPYEPFYEIFSSQTEVHPMSNRPESKRSFLPSRNEALLVSKMVNSIKMGWMKPRVMEEKRPIIDLWGEESDTAKTKNEQIRLRMHFAAPKVELPGHVESYNPPSEYLFDDNELEKYKETQHEDRSLKFIPQKFHSYRKVPAYSRFYNDRYERCLDLYLAPRKRKMKLSIDPSQLLPELPNPEDLRPFPTSLAFYMRGHNGQVRAMSFESSCSELLASGGEDCVLRVWSIASGRCLKAVDVGGAINCVAYRPSKEHTLLALAVETGQMLLINAGVGDRSCVQNTQWFLEHLDVSPSASDSVLQWNKDPKTADKISINLPKIAKEVIWHPNGNYIATFAPNSGPNSVFVHQLSTCKSQAPFSRIKGTVTGILFHPRLPHFFVATQRNVRIYDLKRCQFVKKILTGSRWVSCINSDSYGSNLFIGGLDRVFSWIDLDFSTKPWKTFRHHQGAVRSIAHHRRYPLLATASDDSTALIYHARVSTDMHKDNELVPLKRLRAHTPKNGLSILCVVFHPSQPWVVTAGADGLIALFSY